MPAARPSAKHPDLAGTNVTRAMPSTVWRLPPGEGDAEAEVVAVAGREVLVLPTPDVEPLGLWERRRVAVGGRPPRGSALLVRGHTLTGPSHIASPNCQGHLSGLSVGPLAPVEHH